MATAKEDKKLPSKITVLLVGKSAITTIERKKYTLNQISKDLKEEIKKMVENYNKLPSANKLAKLVKIFTPVTTKQEVAKKVEKKVKHVQVKKVKGELKEAKATKQKLLAGAQAMTKEIREFLKGDSRFEVKDGLVYLVPYYQVPLPNDLVGEIKRYIDDKLSLDPLINFWMLALLNPNPVARTKMFGYLFRHKLIITPSGYFVTYRMVKKTDDPNVFTHAHSVGTGKQLYYKPGTVARIPRVDCDEDGSRDCSRGLHTGTPNFIGISGLENLGDGYKKANNSSGGGGYGTGYSAPEKQTFSHIFGNQAIICLVNPMHVVSVPESDTRKMRSCEFYFCKLTTVEEVVKLQTDEYRIFDHTYQEHEAEELRKMLKITKLQNYVDKSSTDLTAKKRAELEEKIEGLKKQLTLGGDSMSKDLTIDHINSIIQSRVIKK